MTGAPESVGDAKGLPRKAVFQRCVSVWIAYRFRMCTGLEGELTGQISINELLIAMGEDPVDAALHAAADDAPALLDPPPLPGL